MMMAQVVKSLFYLIKFSNAIDVRMSRWFNEWMKLNCEQQGNKNSTKHKLVLQ